MVSQVRDYIFLLVLFGQVLISAYPAKPISALSEYFVARSLFL